MKRKVVCLTCLVLALGPAACVLAADADAEIPAAGSSITTDGIRESAWFNVPEHEI
jgi:hypothetical protein